MVQQVVGLLSRGKESVKIAQSYDVATTCDKIARVVPTGIKLTEILAVVAKNATSGNYS